MNNSRSDPIVTYYGSIENWGRVGRLRKQVFLADDKSLVSSTNRLRALHSTLIWRVHTGYARHRSPCARTLTAQLEAIRPSSTRTDAAAMGRSRPYGDDEPCNARAPDTLQIGAVEPTAARKPHRQLGISKLVRHRAAQPAQCSRPDAQETGRSKLPGSGHDIRPGERTRGCLLYTSPIPRDRG